VYCLKAELFDQHFPACFARICECIHESREKDISGFAREVLDYLNEHLYDPNLYTTDILLRYPSVSPFPRPRFKNWSSRGAAKPFWSIWRNTVSRLLKSPAQ
jgi:hypothetical protein